MYIIIKREITGITYYLFDYIFITDTLNRNLKIKVKYIFNTLIRK